MSKKAKWAVRIISILWLAFLYLRLKNPPFNFLVLNTFLALIPIELSFHLGVKKPKNSILFWILFIIWMLFYPNTPYLLTDLFHLSLLNPYGTNGLLRLDNQMWLNFTLLLVSALFTTIIGMWGVKTISRAIAVKLHLPTLLGSNLVVLLITLLSSTGIFIGRFLRIHTIYLFLTPEQFINPLLNMWNRSTIIFIILLTVVQLVFYYTLELIVKSDDTLNNE